MYYQFSTMTTEQIEKTKISFMGWGTDAEIATYTAMIDQFEAAYPDVEVEYIVVADNEFDTKLQTMIGSGQARASAVRPWSCRTAMG